MQTHGLGTLPFITLACGGLQLATGVVRGGGVAKYVPESVIAGFTTGIGFDPVLGYLTAPFRRFYIALVLITAAAVAPRHTLTAPTAARVQTAVT